MTLGNKLSNIKRAGFVTTLAATMLVSLAACGGAPATTTPVTQPTAQATATEDTGAASPVETTVGEALETAETTAPDAVGTETSDMGDMGEMAEGTTTPTPATTDTNVGATATPAGAADQGTTAGATTEINATLREWALDLDQTEVPAGRVVFNVTNAGQFAHNLTVEDSTGVIGKTPNFGSADGVQTLELELTPGTYNIICSLPGHATRGQQNTLVVK
jgi:uncharacterized cupredoxin-like copper-binding protein